jgi:carboxypeptidase Taq
MSFFDTLIQRFKPETPPDDLPKATADFSQESTPVSKQDQAHACPSYTSLKGEFRDIGRMNAIIEALGRDFLTAMPDGAYKSRLGQMAFLYRRMHEDLIGDHVHKHLSTARYHEYENPNDWDEWDSANLREMEDMYRMYCHVDPELMEKKAQLSYEGRRRHRELKKTGNWDEASVFLQEQIDLHRKIADSRCKATGESSQYQMLMSEYMPGMKVFDVENLMASHEAVLKDMLPEILKKQQGEPEPMPLVGDYSGNGEDDDYHPVAQMWLNKALLDVLGFDFNRGGLYETGHNPVEGGTVDDTRLVITNVDRSDFLNSMKSALHEGGHGLYIQGLPRKTWRYQPVAMDMGAAVHESQALLIEMIIGRMPEFFEFLSPRLEGLFHFINSDHLSAENLYSLKTRVNPTPDRKKADEITYFYHVLLRFRLERNLINGHLDVKDLPEAWVEGTHDLLGILPESHIDGCLQDVHWFVGKFGYFPSYAIGHMMGAQLFYAMEKDLGNIGEHVARGELTEIREWLAERIYSKGRLMNMHDLVKEATGQPLKADYLEKHLRARYLGG